MNSVVILLSLFLCAIGQDVPEIDAGVLGKIFGTYAKTLPASRERVYMQFRGIKYGKQPARFMPSELREELLSEDGVYNATQYGSNCPQPDERYTYSEDCLFLNIFAPNISEKRHPVILFIPGAGFTSGGGDWMRGERMLNKDVILVILNHRLGIHGACNLELPDLAPGNGQLSDTITALKWIQSFISYFGGDPNLVTIAGQSSGGAMASHALVSPKFRGLVHRVIAVSGSTLDPSTVSRDHSTAALKVAVFAGCYDNSLPVNKTQVAICLRDIPHEELSRAQDSYYVNEMKMGTSIGFEAINPSLQSFLAVDEAIIPQMPETALEKGEQNNVPLMMMVTRDDGSFGLSRYHEEFLIPNDLVNDTDWMREKLVQAVFKAVGIHDPGHTVSGAFSKMYIVEEARLAGNFSALVPSLFDLMSVIFFKAGTLRSIQLHSKLNSDTYYFSFEYEGRYKRHPFYSNYQGEVGHADDQIYLFQLSGEFNEEEQALSDMMVNYYTNFMYTGNPNTFPPGDVPSNLPLWPKFDTNDEKYLIMDQNTREASKYEDSWVIANRKNEEVVTCPSIPTVPTTTPFATTTTDSKDSSANILQPLLSLLLLNIMM